MIEINLLVIYIIEDSKCSQVKTRSQLFSLLGKWQITKPLQFADQDLACHVRQMRKINETRRY